MRAVGGVELGLASQGRVPLDDGMDANLLVACTTRLK